MMTDDEIIAIVKAKQGGAKIQFRFLSELGRWRVITTSPFWNFEFVEYRVAPEPYCYGHMNEDGDIGNEVWSTKKEAEATEKYIPDSFSLVKLIPAPDEEQPF